MGREDRPADDSYYVASRTSLLSQGDIFADVPRVYAGLAEEVFTEEEGGRRFLSGPLEPGYAMLITPSCSMGGSGAGASYDHPVRTLVPLVPINQLSETLRQDQLAAARRHDGLINYMYLPPSDNGKMAASLAFLYMPITLDHELLMATGRRVTQLGLVGAQQLLRKLVWYSGGIEIDRKLFHPPMD